MRNPLSDKIQNIEPSGIRKFFDIASEMDDVISLGVGEPDFDTPWHIRDEGIYTLEKGKTFYTSNAGLKELREEICRYLKRRFNLEYDPIHETLITVGGSEAIDIGMRCMLNPGDEVLIPQPSYVSYVPCAVMADGVPKIIELKAENDFRLTPEEIRAALDAGTLDEDSIDAQCLADENGLLSWLWKWLFGKKEDNTPAPVYSGWRTVNGKTYYYDQNTNKPVTGIQSIDNKLYYFDADGVQQSAKFGIDVSKYQSNIDFEKAKKAGVEFVIIRIGYRGYGSGTLVLDPMFEQHFTNARNAGLKVGVYFFSQAVNENEAREEAQGCWYVLNSRKLDYPIFFDTEASGASNGSGRADGLGMEDRTKCAIAFCEEVKAQGYKPGVYASTLWYRKRVNLNSLKKYTIWNAHYGVASSPIDCALWQGTCTARLPGYKGDMDVNISYIG